MTRWIRLVMVVLLLSIAIVSCGSDDDEGSADGDGDVAFELDSAPEFTNFVIPGSRPIALVTATGGGDGAIELTGSSTTEGFVVRVDPQSIRVGEVAEVWLEVPDVAGEVAVPVTITGVRGATQRSLGFEARAVPGTDDLAETATDVAEVFLAELGGQVPELPETATALEGGTPVAGLLVVSHYAWFTDDAEIGLAWHVMVAPDDWAELYIRPRGELAPTAAWRLSSWSTALEGGQFTIEEIPAPPEVTR